MFSPNYSNSGLKDCGKGFVCCQYITEGTENTFKMISKKFEIRIPSNCESKNLIYILICSSCKEYIGQTQTMLSKRLKPADNIFNNQVTATRY